MKAVKELDKDEDIVILPANKGRSMVVMNREDYSSKLLAILEDRDTYQLVANCCSGEQDEQFLTEPQTGREPPREDILPLLQLCWSGSLPL